MTKQIDPAMSATDRPALEIEITEEMIEAGADALADASSLWVDEKIPRREAIMLAESVLRAFLPIVQRASSPIQPFSSHGVLALDE
jgi:hypothetical protein